MFHFTLDCFFYKNPFNKNQTPLKLKSSVLIRFSGLFRHNMYIMLYIFWKIEVCSFQNWQNHIENLNEEEHGLIQKWRIWSLWKSHSPPTRIVFLKTSFSMGGSCYCVTRFCRNNLYIASFTGNVKKVYLGYFFLCNLRI